jgi:hypothetical protein
MFSTPVAIAANSLSPTSGLATLSLRDQVSSGANSR